MNENNQSSATNGLAIVWYARAHAETEIRDNNKDNKGNYSLCIVNISIINMN